MSYANMIMYNSVLPSYDSKKSEGDGQEDVIDADDQKNKDRVRKMLFG
jgi:hypothetical protein